MYAPHRPAGSFLLVAAALLLGACAYAIPEVDPADIPDIERRLGMEPDNTDLMVQLGMARFKAGEYEAAREVLQTAVDAGNESGPALLYLGMVHEEFGDWAAARDAYNRYLEVGRSEPLKAELRRRLQYIAQNILKEQAREALAREEELAATDPQPRTVAIFPFAFNSDDENLEPLIYALADMMTTDFAVSNAITVLERAQIQALLDEMALTEAGYAEQGTGARAGRLLRAEHVIQGVLTPLGEEISVTQEVLNVPNASSVGRIDEAASLQQLFDMEKQLVFRTFRDVLGIELTPAEEQRILENRTDNVLAFLAYGRGLRLKDQGQYEAAAQAFQQAQQLDPGFEAATQELVEAETLQDAAQTTTDDLAQTAAQTGETTQQGAVAPPPATTTGSTTTDEGGTTQTASTLNGASEAVNPTPTSGTIDLGSTQQKETAQQQTASEDRSDAVQESQGQENVTTAAQAQIRIVIRRPGGGDQ